MKLCLMFYFSFCCPSEYSDVEQSVEDVGGSNDGNLGGDLGESESLGHAACPSEEALKEVDIAMKVHPPNASYRTLSADGSGCIIPHG